MQFNGGYRYPSNKIIIVLSIIVLIIAFYFYSYKCFSLLKMLSLLFNLEGTVLIASSLSPVGLAPPPKGIKDKMVWFIKNTKGVPLSYNLIMLYGGLLSIFIGSMISLSEN